MRTDLCDLFGIDVPIFAFSHCRDVVAAVTNAGGLGVLGALAFSPEQLELECRWIDDHVDGKPYGVDTVMPMSYAGKDEGLGKSDAETGKVDASVFQQMIPEETKQWIERVLEEYEVPPLPDDLEFGDSGVGGGGTGLLGWTEGGGRNHVDVALRHAGVKLLVNALGPPPKDIIDLAHAHGVKVAALTGAVEHAQRQKQAGVDIIIAQGTEAGGHTGEIGSMVLIPDIVEAVAPTPVLGAGGIASGRQAAAAMALGASGVWTGSVWLTVREADISPLVKEKLFSARPKDAVRSRSLSGKPARLLRTAWTEAWEREECPGTLPMPLQYMVCSEAQTRINLAARKEGAKARELVGMPVGQVVGRLTQEVSSADVIYQFIDEFIETVDRLRQTLDAANTEQA
ncbi:MAG: nitronate monooxygenase [Deltaproteobacteria bacterium]|nr:nitronate monooxygenase [Deltaproteobacteria bacterium]MBW2361527.1 nitronate monooxygenase [Deltaproteobacteria bacterium]